jgi:hypothetical protein
VPVDLVAACRKRGGDERQWRLFAGEWYQHVAARLDKAKNDSFALSPAYRSLRVVAKTIVQLESDEFTVEAPHEKFHVTADIVMALRLCTDLWANFDSPQP